MNNQDSVSSVEDLVGRPIDGVCFYADYVQFDLLGPVLRLMDSPIEVIVGPTRVEFPGNGSSDVLRGLIGETIARVEFGQGRVLIETVEGSSLVAPVDPSADRESVHFVPWADGRLLISAMEIW